MIAFRPRAPRTRIIGHADIDRGDVANLDRGSLPTVATEQMQGWPSR